MQAEQSRRGVAKRVRLTLNQRVHSSILCTPTKNFKQINTLVIGSN